MLIRGIEPIADVFTDGVHTRIELSCSRTRILRAFGEALSLLVGFRGKRVGIFLPAPETTWARLPAS